jgi:hypothetical protein
VPRVMGGLLDEVKDHPSKVEWLPHAEQDVRRWEPALLTNANDLQAGGRADKCVGLCSLAPIGVNHLCKRDVRVQLELLLARWERVPEIAALDPAPLDVDEMIDDPDDRKQAIVRGPAGLIVGERVGSCNDQLSLAVQVPKKQLAFVERRHDHLR